MKKDFLLLLKNRRTVFDFSDTAVSPRDIERILDAARWAPSSNNAQNWRFIVVSDPAAIRQLFDSCVYGSFYSLPPVVIAMAANPVSFGEREGHTQSALRDLNETHMFLNIGFVTACVVFAAESLGIGSCIVSLSGEAPARLLDAPDGVRVPLLVGLGFERPEAFYRSHERKPLAELMSNEKYA